MFGCRTLALSVMCACNNDDCARLCAGAFLVHACPICIGPDGLRLRDAPIGLCLLCITGCGNVLMMCLQCTGLLPWCDGSMPLFVCVCFVAVTVGSVHLLQLWWAGQTRRVRLEAIVRMRLLRLRCGVACSSSSLSYKDPCGTSSLL